MTVEPASPWPGLTIAKAKKFEQLLAAPSADPRYHFDRLFSSEGFGARLRSKRKFQILKALDRVLSRMLYPDESVHFLTWGVQSSFWEAYFFGWVLYYLNRTAILLTSHRVLMIRIDKKGRPRDLVCQLRYDAIESIRKRWSGATTITTRDGKSLIFEKLPKQDREHMRTFLDELRSSAELEQSGVRGPEDLCPHCWEPVDGRPRTCPYCDGEFKSPAQAIARSFLFPGLGDWYLGHRAFATMEIVGAALVWLVYWLPPMDESGSSLPYGDPAEWWIGAVGLFLVMHGFDAWVTRHIARKGLYPGRPGSALEPVFEAAAE